MLRRALADAELRGHLLLLAPYLAGLAALVLFPALLTFGLSLFEYDLVRDPVFVGVANFAELTRDPIFHAAVRNTLEFVIVAVPLRITIALGLALLLHRPMRGGTALRSAVYLPTVVPEIALALTFVWLFNPLYGPINLGLGALNWTEPGWLTDPVAARFGVVLYSTILIGESFVVLIAVRRSLPAELYELAAIERAGPIATLRHVTLPILAPVILLLAARDILYSLQVTLIPALVIFGGGPPPNGTTYLPFFTYRAGFEYLRYGHAAAATVAMFAVTLVVVVIQYRLFRRLRDGLT